MQGQHRTRCWRMRIRVSFSREMLMASALWSPLQSFVHLSVQSWSLWVIILINILSLFCLHLHTDSSLHLVCVSQSNGTDHPPYTSQMRLHLETLYECATQGGKQTLQRRRWQKEESRSDKESARLQVVMLRGRNASENLHFMWVQTE